MSEIKTVCVYCGSRNPSGQYEEAARRVGEIIGQTGRSLVYGGSRSGLMGIVADSVLKEKQPAVGVIPYDIQNREERHDDLSETIMVDNMHERKGIMAKRADAFAVLPGGLGTLDETFEIITWKQLGFHNKPITIVNINNYWDGVLNTIDDIIAKGFASEGDNQLFEVITDPEELMASLERQLPETLEAQTDKF